MKRVSCGADNPKGSIAGCPFPTELLRSASILDMLKICPVGVLIVKVRCFKQITNKNKTISKRAKHLASCGDPYKIQDIKNLPLYPSLQARCVPLL